MSKRYDVFLSHNSADTSAVEYLAQKLRDAGLVPFLDKWHLIPGEPWQEALEAALDQSRTCAVFLGSAGLGPWENEEMRAALEERVHAPDFRVIPVLLPDTPMPERGRLPRFLSRLTWVDFRKGLEDADAFYRLTCGIKGIPPVPTEEVTLPEDVCPYRGLQPFQEEHAEFFFGREALTQWLVEGLRDSRFLAVIGPSGSGKSSVVCAGLIPTLRQGTLPGSETWTILVMTPGPRPLEELAAHLAPVLNGGGDRIASMLQLQDRLRADPRALHTAVRLALAGKDPTACALIVVDQFEELFTLCRDEEARQHFLDNLLYASGIAQGRTVVVIAMRADFYARAAVYPELADRMADHQVLVTPMEESELRQAIAAPAQRVGLSFDPGLVDTILEDVLGEPGALPLLEHALLELWERRRDRRLTFDAYREIGGVDGAIARRAEAEYGELTAEQQAVARRILLRLVQPGEGTEDTRRRARLKELLPDPEQAPSVEAVVQKLTNARLLTTGRGAAIKDQFVEMAHEALIRGWPRLQEWIQQDRVHLLLHRRLAEAAKEWDQHDRDRSYLYGGSRLDQAKQWATSHLDMLDELERDFLFHSVIEENTDLQDWLPRYGNVTETTALANQFLQSDEATERLKGLSVLRWLPDEADDEINPLLLQIVLTDKSQAISNRAAEVLCERDQILWFTGQLRSPDLSPGEKSRLIRALGHSRNLPKLGVAVADALRGPDRRRVLRSAAFQLVSDNRTALAFGFSIAFIIAVFLVHVISIVIAAVVIPLERLLAIGIRLSSPAGSLSLAVLMTVGLYALIRSHIDRSPITVGSFFRIGFVSIVIASGLDFIRSVISALVRYFDYPSRFAEGQEAVSLLVSDLGLSIGVLVGAIVTLSVLALSLPTLTRTLTIRENRYRKLLLYSALASAIAAVWRELTSLGVFYFQDRELPSGSVRDIITGVGVASVFNFLLGTAFFFVFLVGFLRALRSAFGYDSPYVSLLASEENGPE